MLNDAQSGEHDINQEITSPNNKSLALHDSKGLESGSAEYVRIIADFVQSRKGRPFAEQLHAIWCRSFYCRSWTVVDALNIIGIASRFLQLARDHLKQVILLCSIRYWKRKTKVRNKHSTKTCHIIDSAVVPVIVAFTKIDRLEFRVKKRLKQEYVAAGMDSKIAMQKAAEKCLAVAAAEYEKSCVDILRSDFVPKAWVSYCAVSNKSE
jgi:predicted GTPase